ncbi:MAG: hypothetical protein V7K33_15415 [Nostoc sp.]
MSQFGLRGAIALEKEAREQGVGSKGNRTKWGFVPTATKTT